MSKNAMNRYIRRMLYDTIVVGAGPLGVEMGAVLKRAGVSYLHLEAGARAARDEREHAWRGLGVRG